jgi:hypothetical protein
MEVWVVRRWLARQMVVFQLLLHPANPSYLRYLW